MKSQLQASAALAATLLALGAGQAAAQTMNANASSYNAGYGRNAGSDNRYNEGASRSMDGNRLIVDGIIQTGEGNQSYSRQGGVYDRYAGAGALGGATAIGNSLNVVVQGNRNTVVVNSRQVNNGDVIAGVSSHVTVPQPVTPTHPTYATGQDGLNGEIDLDDDGL